MVIHKFTNWDEDGNYTETACGTENFTHGVEADRLAGYVEIFPNATICAKCFK